MNIRGQLFNQEHKWNYLLTCFNAPHCAVKLWKVRAIFSRHSVSKRSPNTEMLVAKIPAHSNQHQCSVNILAQ